ncbi:glycoside hydrolase N-terminal domain-containing protein [Streptomyces sp. NPDC097727]|uniref:glycoside hydrolase N-terminal domain-containing protein n=1 Tax=Streptomyces sp. NPDC097727 TaxID=3366092 RepID=UPI0038250D28
MTSGTTRRTTVKTAIGATSVLLLGIPALSGTAAAVSTSDESTEVKGSAYSRESAEPTLRYDTPAASWECESLPIGGGALGASVYGTLASERLTFNEKALWTGGPGPPRATTSATGDPPRPPGELGGRVGARASRPGRFHRRHGMGRGAGPPCGDHGEP